jgi:hypothetical protein
MEADGEMKQNYTSVGDPVLVGSENFEGSGSEMIFFTIYYKISKKIVLTATLFQDNQQWQSNFEASHTECI